MSALLPSRSARYWQVAALLVAVLPQVDRLPIWLTAGLLLACIWRLPLVEARLGAPGRLWRVLIMLAGMAAVFYSHRTFLGPEGGVSFLLLCAGLKLLESRNRRDLFISAVLNFFVLATAFLFTQSMLLALYVGAATVVVLAALLALQQRPGVGVPRTLRRAGTLALQALPLMLVLFVFFPRLPPLWTFNLTQGMGRTGMSDSMSPGDISRLSESSAVAFRVEFQGAIPPLGELYWRGVAFNYFDGKTWAQGDAINWPVPAGQSFPAWISGLNAGSDSLRYRVILEPTDQPWLFSLAVPRSDSKKVLLTRDYRLAYQTPVYERISYEVQSWPDLRADAGSLPLWLRNQLVQLPAGGNPEARRMAGRWHASAGSDERYVSNILDWFREERFFYTLEPPLLGENRIDDFLFRTRRGFCEHYASAFVFLMRAAGVPARVVAGYQGGEKSPLDNYWLVRQLDAHAWAEVWLEGQGWVRVDPTSVVAPQRIERGAAQLADERSYWGDSGMGAVRHNNYRLLKGLRNFADFVNYRWYRDVLGYDTSRQDGFMRRLLGDASLLRRLAVMAGALVLLAGLAFVWALRGERRKQHPLDRLYRRYCVRMAARGVVRQAGEGPQDFARRVALQQPALASEAAEFARLYAALRYRPAGQSEKVLEKRLRRLAGRKFPWLP